MKFHEKYFKRFDLIVINKIPGKKLAKLKKWKKNAQNIAKMSFVYCRLIFKTGGRFKLRNKFVVDNCVVRKVVILLVKTDTHKKKFVELSMAHSTNTIHISTLQYHMISEFA